MSKLNYTIPNSVSIRKKLSTLIIDLILALDQLLQEGRTDQNGAFRVGGNARQITDIDPKLNIYHKVGIILDITFSWQRIAEIDPFRDVI